MKFVPHYYENNHTNFNIRQRDKTAVRQSLIPTSIKNLFHFLSYVFWSKKESSI